MQVGSYFMSEEAEKAAKWEIIERYRGAKEKLSLLEDRCREIGGSISAFGSAIATTPEAVTIAKLEVSFPKYAGASEYERHRSERAIMALSNLNIDALKDLVDDYKQALQIKSEALRKLREMKVDLEPDTKA